MATKNYYGKCGSCKHCNLGKSYKSGFYTYSFECTGGFFNKYVKADEDPCNKYEPDRSRTNEMIDKYANA